MPKNALTFPVLLRWSEHVPSSDIQDPLGLSLRGSARLAAQLLHCITSITPRARYFSFLPWAVQEYLRAEKGKPYALGLREAVALREQGLALGCVAHHEGKSCEGGSLVGSDAARDWFAKGSKMANFRSMGRFTKNPAWEAYYNSLVNLGVFVTDDEVPLPDEGVAVDQKTIDDLELSTLGKTLADAYEASAGHLEGAKRLSSKERSCPVSELAVLGDRGGLCELRLARAVDRNPLRDVFFATTPLRGDSHPVRRRSLLLILNLVRTLSARGISLDERGFASATYFGELMGSKKSAPLSIPSCLQDIATRWRMFYFHHYMSVALEGLFVWLVTNASGYGLGGTTIDAAAAGLQDRATQKTLSELLGFRLKSTFGSLSPASLFAEGEIIDGHLDLDASRALDERIRLASPLSEPTLEDVLRGKQHLHSSSGLGIPMLLLATTLARYSRWEVSKYGNWLANAASDPFLDLLPPVVLPAITRRFGDWWTSSWADLTRYVVSRFVVQQHTSMSYEKTWAGDRCLLTVNGDRITSSGAYDDIGLGNPRFRSAVQVLQDLGLLHFTREDVLALTKDGDALLARELPKEADVEVS